VHAIKLRRLVVMYLLALPFAIGPSPWFTTLVTALVAYPLLAIDQIGIELQNPFSQARLSHLPLDEICETIETNVLALLDEAETPREGSRRMAEHTDEVRHERG
jgi:putative membrane protein